MSENWFNQSEVEIALRSLAEFSGGKQATVVGRSERIDALSAAFLNAAGANVHDFCDTHVPTVIHPTAPVAAALHHVSHAHLADPTHAIHCDVLVCGDDERAKTTALGLVRDLGLRGLDAGPLDNAVALESLTPVLIYMNKKYKSPGAGIVFTELPDGAGS